MYNLRFYINDDDIAIKCDYKHISNSDQIDLMFYNEMIQSKAELTKAFRTLAKHDLNHKYTIHQNYILHEFVVPPGIIADMREKMELYKARQDKKREENLKSHKFVGTDTQKKQTTPPTKKKKYKLKRENKYVKRRIALSLLTLLTISGIVYGGVKVVTNAQSNDLKEDTVIEMNIDEDALKPAGVAEVIENADIPSITGMVDTINENLNNNNYDYALDIAADDWTGTSKYINCYNNYNDLITKYANMYGIDPKVALAIACHERGEHSSEIDGGGGLGLYQIQVSVWDGNDIRAFNFETNEWETYTIELDNIRNLEQNIKAGMMIFQDCLRRDDYNIAMAVQEYNFGHGGLLKAINAASNDLGVDSEVLETFGNTDWLDYRTYNKSSKGYQMGDPSYIENVFKYINDGEILTFRTPDNENITIKYDNLNYQNEQHGPIVSI